MDAVICALAHPGEALADPARGAARVGALLAALRGAGIFSRVLLAAAPPLDARSLAPDPGATALPPLAGPAAPAHGRPWPEGARRAARALLESGADPGAGHLFVNYRWLAPGPPAALGQALANFAARARAAGRALAASAGTPADHPCQLRRLFTIRKTLALAPCPPGAEEATPGLAALLAGAPESAGPPSHTALAAGRAVAALLPGGPGGARLLLDARLRPGAVELAWSTGRARPEPQDDPAPAGQAPRVLRFLVDEWAGTADATPALDLLLLDAVEHGGPFDLSRFDAPPGAPWRPAPDGRGMVRTDTGRRIQGRQDFPPVLVPDAGLLHAADLRALAAEPPAPPALLEFPGALVARTAIDLLRAELAGLPLP
ncbi:hypothetical protein [Desulfocurvus vexinensis]|uniref:hypothetical protein n=1 Tax=Desulfocurvus vexinensis TaxID=399548 RepID=UPI00048AA4A6|nr:hypothetical protein [Desulfocurvus vexinensis]